MLIRTVCARVAVIVLLVSSLAPVPANAGAIDRVEPPFWWQGFENKELQIMIHGHGTARFDVAVDYPGIEVNRVEPVENENYLFVYVAIDASAKPGIFDIVLKNDDLTVVHEYELKQKNPDPAHTKGFSAADAIYLITPDRFANGDLLNDSVQGFGDQLDRDDDYGRHGGDFAGLTDSVPYIRDMGFTAIWLNPVLENAMPEASYHGYATTDFYKVDPRFGSNEQYRSFVTQAKAEGLGVIMDMIVNHIGSEHWWVNDLPTSDWLNEPDERPISTHARTTIQDPYASEFDKSAHADGWFVDAMPDLNQRNPLLADYLTQNAIWWIEYLGLSGIRMDTQPYPDKHYMGEWSRRIMEEYPQFNLTGEEWSANPVIVSYWQRGKENHDGFVSAMPSMLDFPIQIALRNVLNAQEPEWGSVWTPLYEMLGNDHLYPDPGNLVIFPDNHDMDRIYTQVGENDALYRMAIAYYLTMRGVPQFFYGTEVLLSHPGTTSHGAIREDFPGGWQGDTQNAFTGEGLDDKQRDAQAFMRRLLTWRKSKHVIHSGQLMQFTPIKSVYAYFRYDENDTVMVVFNRGNELVALDMERFTERLGNSTQARDVISDRRFNIDATLDLEPMSVLILEVQ